MVRNNDNNEHHGCRAFLTILPQHPCGADAIFAMTTLLMMGFSSSLSRGMNVLCTQVFVHRCRRRTNDDLIGDTAKHVNMELDCVRSKLNMTRKTQ